MATVWRAMRLVTCSWCFLSRESPLEMVGQTKLIDRNGNQLLTPSVMLYCAHGPKVSKKINHGTLFDHFPNEIRDFKVIDTNRLIEEPQNNYFSIEFPLRFAIIAIFRGILFSNFRVDISTTVRAIFINLLNYKTKIEKCWKTDKFWEILSKFLKILSKFSKILRKFRKNSEWEISKIFSNWNYVQKDWVEDW